ncbi:putative 2-oxoglutarate-dependent dioxygenase AOP1 [Bidens hawaiensis]|uniref:putative 2-oxoglutarate-dependent dioxygenase AOP1 n=1 Tax=Bidens hawaiensis TaxID=980011 RepID=UPI0040492E1A
MVSVSESKLPVINMEDLKPGTESWNMTSHKVRQALEEYGCCMAIYGGFSQEAKKEVYDALKTLFDLPVETKMKNTSDKPFHGYLGPFHTRPLYESLGIECATSYDSVQSFTNLMWPSGNENFSKTMHSYANLVSKLDHMVRKMVFESYGVEKYYESSNESMTPLFRVMKYRPAKADESNLGSVTHTDKHFLTILNQNQVDGLEVQIKDDDEMVAVEFHPSSFVVMATDAFMAWSNGKLRSPRHRVVMNGQEDRYSIALFTFKNGTVEIPEEFVDDEHPPRFKPFDHFKFLESYAKNPIYTDERAIKLFSGV